MKGCAQVISDDKQLLIESAIVTLLFLSFFVGGEAKMMIKLLVNVGAPKPGSETWTGLPLFRCVSKDKGIF